MLVVHDESRIDGHRPSIGVNGHGLYVATDHWLTLEEPDFMVPAHGVGRGQAAHAGSDDSDSHGRSDAVSDARASSWCWIPPAASWAIFAKVPPMNGWTSRMTPRRVISAV